MGRSRPLRAPSPGRPHVVHAGPTGGPQGTGHLRSPGTISCGAQTLQPTTSCGFGLDTSPGATYISGSTAAASRRIQAPVRRPLTGRSRTRIGDADHATGSVPQLRGGRSRRDARKGSGSWPEPPPRAARSSVPG
jgi:hypothetical protein